MNALASHYQQKDQKHFDPNNISAVDQFYIGGLQATNDMLAPAGFS
jgi:hypothetical protein